MKNKKSGFALVELMVVVLLVGLAVLVLKQIPLFGLEAWSGGAERMTMQQDGYYGILRMQRRIRTASLIEEPLVSVPNSSTLVVGDTTFLVNENHDLTENGSVLVSGDSGTWKTLEQRVFAYVRPRLRLRQNLHQQAI